MSPRFLILLASAAIVAGGCALSNKEIAQQDRARLQMRAAEVTAELKVDTIVSGEKLGDSERSAVKMFAESYQHEGHGKVIISRPSAGPDDVAGLRAAADARSVLLADGVDAANITDGPYDANGARSAPLVITYKTWEARVPGCPDVAHYDISWTGTNAALPSFGCAVAADLAAQIADAGDLVGNHDMDPSDTRRRTIQLTKYRNGEQTGAARNQDASGAISKAVGN